MKKQIFDRKILKEACYELCEEAILTSKKLNKKLTKKEKMKLIAWLNEQPYENIVYIVTEAQIRDFESKAKKALKYGFAAIAGGVVGKALGFGGAKGIGIASTYLYRKLTDPCTRQCFQRYENTSMREKWEMWKQRKICKYTCQIEMIRRIMNMIKSDARKCANTGNPEKCERSLQKEWNKWDSRYRDSLGKLSKAKTKSLERQTPEKVIYSNFPSNKQNQLSKMKNIKKVSEDR